jgi:hypothetical protein
VRQESEQEWSSDREHQQQTLARFGDSAASEERRKRQTETDETADERDLSRALVRRRHRPLAQGAIGACKGPEPLADDRHAVGSRHAAQAGEGLELVEAAKNRLHRPTLPGLGPPGKGRAAYLTETLGLPPAAREEAEQREHEDDDQDDPENAQGSHLLPASFSKNRSPSREGALNPSATFTARDRP